MNPKFLLGRTVITRNALERLSSDDVQNALDRHVAGDWGEELPTEDVAENELSLCEGFRLLSAYRSASGEKFWVITEADRSSTTVLMPEDY